MVFKFYYYYNYFNLTWTKTIYHFPPKYLNHKTKICKLKNSIIFEMKL